VLLHAAIYCGVPTAVEAFRTANEVVAATVKRRRFNYKVHQWVV